MGTGGAMVRGKGAGIAGGPGWERIGVVGTLGSKACMSCGGYGGVNAYKCTKVHLGPYSLTFLF